SLKFPIAIGIRKDETALLADINNALDAMKRDGALKRIYQQWGMYNSVTADYFGDEEPVSNANADRYRDYLSAMQTERSVKEHVKQYWSFLPLLLRGASVTVALSVVSMALAIGFGLLLAVIRVFGPRLLTWLAIGFI